MIALVVGLGWAGLSGSAGLLKEYAIMLSRRSAMKDDQLRTDEWWICAIVLAFI
jgi:hypothetical protein